MGGVIFLISTIITSLFYVKDYPKIIPVLFLTLGFGLIGFLDDYLKVVLRRSDGLLPWQKFLLQVVCNRYFHLLSAEIYRCIPDYAHSVLGRTLSEPWMACGSGSVFCRDRNCQWRELHRRC